MGKYAQIVMGPAGCGKVFILLPLEISLFFLRSFSGFFFVRLTFALHRVSFLFVRSLCCTVDILRCYATTL
jgi:hypothetical protein